MMFQAGARVACFGECMLELQGQAFGPMRQSFGGDTLNTAVYLARCGRAQGLQVEYATALGDDVLSDGMLQRWCEEGVGTGLVRRLAGRRPGLYLIEVNEQGERSFHYWRGQSAARDHFDTAFGDTPLEQQAPGLAALYFSGISLAIIGAQGRKRLFALAAAMRQRGAHVVFDNNHRPALWPNPGEARAAHEEACTLADMALLTLDDEVLLWGDHSADAALERLRALPTPECVVKRGSAPTLVGARGAWVEVPTSPVAKVVDSTAAGDSFAGAYLAARLAGANPVQAAAAGNHLAAVVIQHPGAIAPLHAMPRFMSPV